MRKLMFAVRLDAKPLTQKIADLYYERIFAPAMETYFQLEVAKYRNARTWG